MSEQSEPTEPIDGAYPLGRGYGHDYMRGGEVLGGYGYSDREEYERRRGDGSGYQGEERRAAGEQPAPDGQPGADLS